MAQLIINVPDAQVQRVLEAFTAVYGYTGTMPGNPPPTETPIQFTRRMLRQYVFQVVQSYEAAVAAEDARATTAEAVGSELTIT